MNSGKHQPVIDVVKRSYSNADSRLADKFTDLFLQFGKRFNIVEFIELKETGFYVV